MIESVLSITDAELDSIPRHSSLGAFLRRLPRAPYHTDDLEHGLRIAYSRSAARSRYIQPNPPAHHYWLVYDIDRTDAVLDWSDRNAPPPTMTAMNPVNGHAHLLYGLTVPVRTAPQAKPGPLRYMASIDCALRERLDADTGYAGLICKNPLRGDAWRVTEWEPRLYSLGDLDSWLDLSTYRDKRKRLPDYGLGRNCNLFESLRKWAYKAIRQGWPDYDRWFEAVLTRAQGYNVSHFEVPLPEAEVRHTARSVAKWVHGHMTPDTWKAYVARTHSSKIQAQRGRKGGQKNGAKRRGEMLQMVMDLSEQGQSQREIEAATGVPQKTVSRWLKRSRE